MNAASKACLSRLSREMLSLIHGFEDGEAEGNSAFRNLA